MNQMNQMNFYPPHRHLKKINTEKTCIFYFLGGEKADFMFIFLHYVHKFIFGGVSLFDTLLFSEHYEGL